MREKSSETALLAGNWQGGDSNRKGGGKLKLDDECHYCHQKGHWVSKCPKWEVDKKAMLRKC